MLIIIIKADGNDNNIRNRHRTYIEVDLGSLFKVAAIVGTAELKTIQSILAKYSGLPLYPTVDICARIYVYFNRTRKWNFI